MSVIINCIYPAIILYLSGCLVARIWIDVLRRDLEIKQVWLSWIYVIKFIITWDWKNKRKKERLGNFSNKDFAILYNYSNNKFNEEFKYIAKKYIKEYGNRLRDAYVYANHKDTEEFISIVHNELEAMEKSGNIINIFKAFWLNYKYDKKSLKIYLANNNFSVEKLKDFINTSLEDVQFSESNLYTGTNDYINGLKLKGRSLLITINNLDITYEII